MLLDPAGRQMCFFCLFQKAKPNTESHCKRFGRMPLHWKGAAFVRPIKGKCGDYDGSPDSGRCRKGFNSNRFVGVFFAYQ